MAPGICNSLDAKPLPSMKLVAKSCDPILEGEDEITPVIKDASQHYHNGPKVQAVCKPSTENVPLLNVLDPRLITDDFHALQYECAALQQLTTTKSEIPLQPLLIASPYNFQDQLLDLRSLDTQDRLFALALTALTPARADYATAPYVDSLNWEIVLCFLRELAEAENVQWKEQDFYVVIFRSKRKEVVDKYLLHVLDQQSHIEATASGGLLKYWFGDPNPERRNVATCLWHSKENARLGGLGPWHKRARAAGREFYETFSFGAYRFTIKDAVAGWSFDQWEEPKGTAAAHPHAPPAAEPSCDRDLPASDQTAERSILQSLLLSKVTTPSSEAVLSPLEHERMVPFSPS